ncbi:MAG: flagellar biosynthetic protein FliR [Phycisphaerae bacterium]
METFIILLLPTLMMLARISAFFAVLPIFSWQALPRMVRASIALSVTIFFLAVRPVGIAAGPVPWMAAVLMIVQEATWGLVFGLVLRLVYSAVEQGGRIVEQQMGTADAGVFDPVTGQHGQAMGTFFHITYSLLFLVAGGHHLFLRFLDGTFDAFPLGSAPDPAAMASGMVSAGSAMLQFALKLAAPVLAAFLLLSVVLAILARVLPEMNILLASFPLRVGMGLFIAAAVMPTLHAFTGEIADWMKRFLMS